MVRDVRLRPAGQGGLLTMRVLNLILRVLDLIPKIPDLIPEFSDLILRSIAKAMRLEG
jgi:hypothetical protein